MASDAGCWGSLVLAAYMAGSAIDRGMHPRQREPCVLQVIKLRAQPGVDGVALFALCRKPAGDVIGSIRLLKRVLMAGITLNR